VPDTLPENPSIDQLKKQAKELMRGFAREDPSIIDRFRRIRRYASLSEKDFFESAIRLHDAQYALALHYGFLSWRQLSDHCAQRHKEKVMNKPVLQEFNELKNLPDRAMQRLLREIDATKIAHALIGAEKATRERVFANMSKRAREVIKETIDSLGAVAEHRIEAAMADVLSIYRKLADIGDVVDVGIVKADSSESVEQAPPIKIIQEKGSSGFSTEDLMALFPELSSKARAFGLLSLESDIEGIDDQIINKGLQLVIDGTDPEYVESIMRSMLEKELQLMRTKYEAVIDSVMSVQQGDLPYLIGEKLEARLA
jgi:hypothetical protein